jgi:hypothetical protein
MKISNFNIIRIIAVALLASMAISYPLWCNKNGFIPVGFSLGIEPFFLLGAALFALICLPQKNYLYVVFLLILGISLAANFTRWQIWVFHLGGLLLLLGWSKTRQIDVIRISLAAAYCWGGFNKINPWFAEFQLDWLLEKPFFLAPFRYNIGVGYGIGIIELLLGIMLVFNKLPKIALLGTLLMHCFVLLLISPWGLDWNHVIVPWNLALMALNIHLYQHRDVQNQGSLTLPMYVAIGLFFIFPSLQYVGIGQQPLSFNMYAGDQLEGTLFFHESDLKSINEDIKKYVYRIDNQKDKICYLKIQDWAMHSVYVPAYSEKWAMEAYAKQFKTGLSLPDSAGIEILTVSHWRLNSAVKFSF